MMGDAGLVELPSKEGYAREAIAAAPPQPSKVVAAGKGWRVTLIGFVTFIVWEVLGELVPLVTPDILELLVARAVAAYPKLVFVKGALFLVLMGIVKALQNYLQVRAE